MELVISSPYAYVFVVNTHDKLQVSASITADGVQSLLVELAALTCSCICYIQLHNCCRPVLHCRESITNPNVQILSEIHWWLEVM